MSKRKKQQQDDVLPGGLAGLLLAMAATKGAVRTATAEDYQKSKDRLIRGIKNSEHTGTVRRVAATRSICTCPARDEVVVVTASAKRREVAQEMAKAFGGVPLRSIVIYALSAHSGSASPVEIDLEDAKKLVNALSEAIAETELITAEAK